MGIRSPISTTDTHRVSIARALSPTEERALFLGVPTHSRQQIGQLKAEKPGLFAKFTEDRLVEVAQSYPESVGPCAMFLDEFRN